MNMTMLSLSGTALVVLALMSGCATGTSKLCSRDARYFIADDSMLTTITYAEAIGVTFPELKDSVCDPDGVDGAKRCFVYKRIDSLERHCYAQRKAEG